MILKSILLVGRLTRIYCASIALPKRALMKSSLCVFVKGEGEGNLVSWEEPGYEAR